MLNGIQHDAISTMSNLRHSDLDIGLEFMARAGLGDRHNVVLDASFRTATIFTVKGRYRSFWQMNHVAHLLPAKHQEASCCSVLK
jgi:hypothetical protein